MGGEGCLGQLDLVRARRDGVEWRRGRGFGIERSSGQIAMCDYEKKQHALSA